LIFTPVIHERHPQGQNTNVQPYEKPHVNHLEDTLFSFAKHCSQMRLTSLQNQPLRKGPRFTNDPQCQTATGAKHRTQAIHPSTG
jgi:hypothetical protein